MNVTKEVVPHPVFPATFSVIPLSLNGVSWLQLQEFSPHCSLSSPLLSPPPPLYCLCSATCPWHISLDSSVSSSRPGVVSPSPSPIDVQWPWSWVKTIPRPFKCCYLNISSVFIRWGQGLQRKDLFSCHILACIFPFLPTRTSYKRESQLWGAWNSDWPQWSLAASCRLDLWLAALLVSP